MQFTTFKWDKTNDGKYVQHVVVHDGKTTKVYINGVLIERSNTFNKVVMSIRNFIKIFMKRFRSVLTKIGVTK
jgi:hypothetical protein